MNPIASLMSLIAGNEVIVLVAFAILILLVVAIMVWLFLRARRKAADAEPVPAAPAKAEAEAEETEKFASPRELRRSFKAGWRVYRDHIAGSRDPHLVPWFLAIGAEGSGKSTLLSSLESSRPAVHTADDQTSRPVGCNWWYYDHAVVLDVGGESILRADGSRVGDRNWRNLLSILRDHRPRRPADGVILTIPAEDLLDGAPGSGQRLTNRALELYGKLWQAQKLLGLCLPVYVVVTKCDALPSFDAFASALPSRLRGDMFGWSNPYPVESAYRAEWLDEAFASLQTALLRTQIELFADDPDPDKGQDIFLFPTQFQQLKEPLRTQLSVIFRRTSYQDSMWLRGIYFTGRASAPEDPLLIGQESMPMLPALSGTEAPVPPGLPAPIPAAEDKAGSIVFARDLFERKIFRERDLARETARWTFERDRRQLAWQVGTGIAAAACLGMLWAGYNRLDALRGGFLPVLSSLPAMIKAADGVAQAPSTGADGTAAARRQIEAFVRAIDRTDPEWDGPFLPGAWVSNIESRVATALSIGYHRVVASATRRRLEEMGTLLAAQDRLPPDGDAYVRFRQFLGEAVLFERFATIFNGITGTFELTGLPEMVKYAFDYDLTAEFLDRATNLGFTAAPTNQALRGASIDAALRPIDLAEYRAAASRRLEQLADAYVDQISGGSEGLKHLREVATTLSEVADARRGSAEVAAAFEAIHRGLRAADGSLASRDALLVGTGDGFGQDLQPLMDLIADSELFGREIHDRISARIQDAVRNAGAGQVVGSVIGPLASYDAENNRVDLTPAARSLMQQLDELFAKPFMRAPEGGREAFHVTGGGFTWDIGMLESAADMAEDFVLFRTRTLPNLPGVIQASARAAAQRRLGEAVLHAVAAAQVPLSSGSYFGGAQTDNDLRLQVRSFAAAIPLIAELGQVFRREGMAEYQTALNEAVASRALSLLAQVDEALAADDLFLLPYSGLNAWAGDRILPHEIFGLRSPRALAEALANQRQRVAVLARDFAEPLVAFLSEPGLRGAAGAAPVVERWQRILAELDRYEAGRPNNSIQQLLDFATITLGDIDLLTCHSVVEQAMIGIGNDYFSGRLASLGEQVVMRCETLLDEAVARGYMEIASAFDRLLSGHYPFGPAGSEAVAPEAILEFYRVFDDKVEAVTAALEARPGLAEGRRAALEFLDRMRRVRAFLQPLLPDRANLDPGYRVEVRFRVNRGAEVGGHEIMEWAATLGGLRTDNFVPAEDLSWTIGQPAELSIRWARNGFRAPISTATAAEIDPAARSVRWRYTGPWALIEMLQDLAADPRDWTPGPGRRPHVLGLEVETVPVGEGSEPGVPTPLFEWVGDRRISRVFVEIALYPKQPPEDGDETAQDPRLEMPVFPMAAPLMMSETPDWWEPDAFRPAAWEAFR